MNPKKQAYLDMRARIEAKCPNLGQHVRLFNNQFDLQEDQQQIPFPYPCVFIEIVSDITWTQLGAGFQIANSPVIFRFHIGSNFYNGTDQEENLEIFDWQDELHAALQYSSGNFNELIRVAERSDTQHTSVYVWQVDYVTTLSDSNQDRPVNGIDTTIDITPVTTFNFVNP